MSRLRAMLQAAALWSAATAIGAESDLAPRHAQLACGPAIVVANALCYGEAPLCVRETLTFRRPGGSTVLSPHPHMGKHSAPAGGSVAALDYHATSWACAEGVDGGRYVAIVMVHASGADCGECQYARLYHPNGNAIAATLKFDSSGRPGGNPASAAMLREILGRPWPGALKFIYDR
ncbi:MAG TPA: hypothetical protein VKF40_13610 [Burkholderiales bacterium]|nr:hypothetical protein [Burkholderiales bacterium]